MAQEELAANLLVVRLQGAAAEQLAGLFEGDVFGPLFVSWRWLNACTWRIASLTAVTWSAREWAAAVHDLAHGLLAGLVAIGHLGVEHQHARQPAGHLVHVPLGHAAL